jgi:excisionase family DNA binding protein
MIAGVQTISGVPAGDDRREGLAAALADSIRRAAAELAEAADLLDALAAEPPPEAVEPQQLTVEQAANAPGIGRSTTAELVASGELPSIKIGKLRRIPAVEVGWFVKRRQAGG